MRQMKDSGIEWIGKIPEDWAIERMKSLFTERNERDCKGRTLLSVSQFWGIRPKSETDIADSHIAESYDDYKEVYQGDFVMNIMLAWNGSYAVSEYDGMVSPAYCVFKFRKDCCKKYFHYLLRTNGYPTAFKTMSRGVIDSRLRLYPEQFYTFPIIIPSIDEQQRIADYLDKKCGEIDSLIALQEQMIEKLKAYKQSVITEAVTKGLDPNAKLVPSGIDWIGEIPEEWKVLKTLFTLKMPITDGPHTTPKLFDNGIPFVSAEAVSCGNGSIDFDHIRGFISQEFYEECCLKYIPEIDDVYMIKSGATTGKVSIVDTDKVFTIWSPLAVFRSNRNIIIPRFMFYTLQGDYYQKQISLYWTFGTQQNIGMRTLEQLAIVLPPLSEQQTIASYLDEKCADIDRLIALKQQKIETLKDYKKSVIYEAVTGKTFL